MSIFYKHDTYDFFFSGMYLKRWLVTNICTNISYGHIGDNIILSNISKSVNSPGMYKNVTKVNGN